MTTHTVPLTDPALPQLARALDSSAMAEVFQDRLFSAAAPPAPIIVHCDIVHTRYKYGRSCLIGYRLSVHRPPDRPLRDHWVCARVYQPGQSRSRYLKACDGPVAMAAFGAPLSWIPELDMVLWAFPNDRKLHGLPKLVDHAYLRSVVVPRLFDGEIHRIAPVASLLPEIVHYVGEHTCTIRLSLGLTQELGPSGSHTFFGKTYDDDQGARAFDAMNALWNSPARRHGTLLMAQPLWYDQRTHTLWQRGLEGRTMTVRDLQHPDGLARLQETGRAVAALHYASRPSVPAHPIHARLSALHDTVPRILAAHPRCRSLLTRIVARLHDGIPDDHPQDYVLLHEDLHIKNLLLTPRGIALIDLDDLRIGSPLHDLGRVLSNLHGYTLGSGLEPALLRRLGHAFLEAYEHETLRRLSRSALSWFVAASLVTERAYRCVTRLKHGRIDLIPSFLRLAEGVLRHRDPLWHPDHVKDHDPTTSIPSHTIPLGGPHG